MDTENKTTDASVNAVVIKKEKLQKITSVLSIVVGGLFLILGIVLIIVNLLAPAPSGGMINLDFRAFFIAWGITTAVWAAIQIVLSVLYTIFVFKEKKKGAKMAVLIPLMIWTIPAHCALIPIAVGVLQIISLVQTTREKKV